MTAQKEFVAANSFLSMGLSVNDSRAGAAEAIACILALQEGIVPPTINLTSPDPEPFKTHLIKASKQCFYFAFRGFSKQYTGRLC